MPNPFKYIETDTLGKLARKYYCDVRTFRGMIERYPIVNDKVTSFLIGIKSEGKKKLPPNIIDEIVETLGNPQTLFK